MTKKIKKILVVEDDQFLLKFFSTKLKQEGFEVVLADDGEKALTKAKQEKLDLILLDLILPKKDGFEVLKEVKEDSRTKRIPVLIMSNLGQESDIKRGKELGAEDYLVKAEFDFQDIVDKINEII